MLRELIEKEASVVKNAVHSLREWLQATKLAKTPAPERAPGLGPTNSGAERREEPPKSKLAP